MDTDISLKEFCNKHNIRIIDTNKRASKYHKMNLQYFRDSPDYNIIELNSEPLCTVEIALSELERIAEFENQMFNIMRQNGQYNMFEVLMEQKEKENYLKEKHPTLKKAYEQYSLLLKLVQTGEL